jgi:hypothetical protein
VAKLSIVAGATSQSVNVFIQDSTSTTGAGLAAVAPAGGSLLTGTIAYYSFSGANASATVISLAVLATVGSAWSSAGIVTIDDTHMKGVCRLDIPNAVIAASKGRSVTVVISGGTNMAPCVLELELTGVDNQDAVHYGLSSLPNATAGASGGLLISGSNAGTTTFGAVTCTGAFTVSDGINVNRSTTNGSGFTVTGNGTGHGAVITSGSGATGDGVQMTAASTNGRGLKLFGTGTGEGFLLNGGATANGITIAAGGTSGVGVSIGTTSGDGINVSAGTNGAGLVLIGSGSGHGIHATAGTTGGASCFKMDGGNAGLNITPTNGLAINAQGGAGSQGMTLTGGSTAAGLRVVGGSTSGNGFEAVGTGSGNAVNFNAGATGSGWSIAGGATSGDAVSISTTIGHGVNIAATGTSKHGVFITGGTAGTSDGLKCVAGTGGVDIRGNITGNLVGTVSTLTTYTGDTPQTGDSYARLGAPSGASVSADIGTKMATYTQPTGFLAATFPSGTVANTTNITAGTITTTTNLTNAPTAGDFTATMKTSIGTAVAASAVASVTAPVAITSNVKKNQALAKFQFLMTDSTLHAPATGKTVTVTRSIDDGAFGAGTLANVAENANGLYTVDFGAGDLNGNVIILRCTASGCDDTVERIITQP